MRHLIVSPHPDDAIFSLGNFMQTIKDVTIISPFAGIPVDEAGQKKHQILNAEHDEACKILGVSYINGPFFDDVYGQTPNRNLLEWFDNYVGAFDRIYIPLGIHHPDHVQIRSLFTAYYRYSAFYEELPYAVLYPKLARQAEKVFIKGMKTHGFAHTKLKEKAVKAYKSQIQNDHILSELFVREYIWKG